MSTSVTVRAREIFVAILELPRAEWPQFLTAACGEDEALRAHLQRLLAAHQQKDTFMVEPVLGPAATSAAPTGELIGETIGPYKLMEQLGEGGMGVVYVAEQRLPIKRHVALKVIKPGMDSQQVVARFEAERQALALMDHPHIARVIDGGTTEQGRPFFVMELVRGIPITEFCDAEQFTIRQRLELFVQVCQAVQHAHQKGIIHRDLKPNNVLVTRHDETPVAKVIDFGVAKAVNQTLTDKTIYTQFSQMIGTPLYMSPEQAQLNGFDIDTRTDVYSLGVLLYELLTGTTPFDAETLRQKGVDEFRRIIREDEPPHPSRQVSTLKAEVSSTVSQKRSSDPRRLHQLVRGELDWIVMRALEKDRSRRYQSPAEFAHDIERYLSNLPVEACPPSVLYRARKYARRHAVAIAGTTTVLLALAIATGISLWQAHEANQSRIAAEQAGLRAEENYQYAREIINKLLVQVSNDKVATSPGMNSLYGALMNEAIDAYSTLISRNPQDAELYAYRAKVYYAVGNWRGAIADLERVVEITPHDYAAQCEIARLTVECYHTTQTEAFNASESELLNALKYAESAISSPSDEILAHCYCASICALLNRRDEAKHHLSIVSQFDLTAPTLVAASVPYIILNDYPTAHQCLCRALETEPDCPDAYLYLGDVLRTLGDHRGAIDAYTKRIQLNPRLIQLGPRLIGIPHKTSTIIAFTTRLWHPHLQRGRSYLDLGEYQKAISDFESAMQISPAQHQFYNYRSIANFHLGNYDQVLDDWKTALELEPNDNTTIGIGIGLEAVVRCPNKQFVEGAFALAPPSKLAELHYVRALVLQEEGDSATAQQEFQRALELAWAACDQPMRKSTVYSFRARNFFFTLAPILRRLERWDEEAQALRMAVEAWNEVPSPDLRERGQAQFRLGNYAKALADSRKFMEKNPYDTRTCFPPYEVAACPDASFRDGVLELMFEFIEENINFAHLHKERAVLYCAMNRMNLARDELAQAFGSKLTANQRYQLALLTLAGNLQEFRRLRSEFIDLSGNGTEEDRYWVAWTCALGPDTEGDVQIIEFADNLDPARTQNHELLLALGGLQYRLGRFAKAEELLHSYLEQPSTGKTSPGFAYYFLAMIHERLDHHEEATKWLAQAESERDSALDELARDPYAFPWNHRLTLDLLDAEAQAMINRPTSEPPTEVLREDSSRVD